LGHPIDLRVKVLLALVQSNESAQSNNRVVLIFNFTFSNAVRM